MIYRQKIIFRCSRNATLLRPAPRVFHGDSSTDHSGEAARRHSCRLFSSVRLRCRCVFLSVVCRVESWCAVAGTITTGAVTSLIPALVPIMPAKLVRLSRRSIADEMREKHHRRVLGERSTSGVFANRFASELLITGHQPAGYGRSASGSGRSRTIPARTMVVF